MSYRCGVGPGMAHLGLVPSGPRVMCDGCGVKVFFDGPMVPQWFLNGKPPRGWRGLRSQDGQHRWDLCPKCWRGWRGLGKGRA